VTTDERARLKALEREVRELRYLRPPDVLLRAVAVGDDRCQSRTIRRGDEKSEVPSHRESGALDTQMSKTCH
jgi:hypothetical protein